MAHLVVINNGKVPAKNLRVEYALFDGHKEAPNNRADGAIGRAAHFREMVPAASETIRFVIPVIVKGKGLDLTDRQFSIHLNLMYNDGLHSSDVVESTTMCGDKPLSPSGGLVPLYYCINFIGEYDKDGKPLKR